ncbi:MAG: TAXI family TRAP transporter solute-binding subunit, partial [Sphingomonadales bacterium]
MKNIRTGARRIWQLTWDRAAIGVPLLALMIAGFVVAYQFVEPAPPDTMVMAAGPEGGVYHRHAMAYRDRLAREGVTLEVLATAGSPDNLARLGEAAVDVAFIQTGVAEADAFPDLRSLGSLYYEPIWVFVRRDAIPDDGDLPRGLKSLEGLRVALGAPGSGSGAVAQRLLDAVGVRVRDVAVSGPAAAARMVTGGGADAAILVAGPTARLLEDLLAADHVMLLALPEAEALTRHFRDLSALTLPATVLDLARGVPARDTPILAATANIVV